MSAKPVVGVMALARTTFDVAYAEETAAKALQTLDALDARVVGPRELLFDADAAARALAELERGRTTFVIAHRESTIERADKRIMLTEDGHHVIEEGKRA